MAEIVDFLSAGVPVAVGEAFADHAGRRHLAEQRRRHIYHVDAPSGDGGLLEVPRIESLYHIDVGRFAAHVIVHQECRIVSGQSIMVIVHGRDGVEISGHQPETVLRRRVGAYGLFADELHLLRAEIVASVRCGIGFLVDGQIGVFLRPGMQRNHVEFLSAGQFHHRPACSVGDDDVAAVAVHALDYAEGILGSDNLGKGVALAADQGVRMSVAGCQEIPIPWEVLLLRHLHLLGRAGLVAGLRFSPDAYIRIQFLDEFHEMVVAVPLVVPHSVLDVPVQDLHFPAPSPACGGQGSDEGSEYYQKVSH